LANLYFDRQQFSMAGQMYDEAIQVARELGDRNSEARALGNLASVRYEQGDIVEAQRFDQQALSIKRAIGDQRSIAFSLINIAETSADLGKLKAAEEMYRESAAIGEKLQDELVIAYADMGLSVVCVRRDRLADAETLIDKALALRRQARDAMGAVDAQISRASVLVERKESEEAASALAAVEPKVEANDFERLARIAVVRAEILLQKGLPEKSTELLSSLLGKPAGTYSLATQFLLEIEGARVEAALGKTSVALERARQIAKRTHLRGLAAFELEATLVAVTIQPIQRQAVRTLIERARTTEFFLVARKAQAALGSAD
jgi:tetratricopeptide (TPR) repeat protein